MSNRTLLTDLTMLEGGTPVPSQVLVSDGRVEAISRGRSSALDGAEAARISLGGALLTPGLVDLHDHLREPGQEDKETIASGTAAAARGGWTTVCAMPNTTPDPYNPGLMTQLRERIVRSASVKVLPYAPITVGLTSEELVDAEAMVAAGAVAFSNDGKGVQSAGVMYDAMRAAARHGRPVAAHAEDNSLVRGGVINAGRKAEELHLPGITRLAETVQVVRDLAIAEVTGAHYHLCHASTRQSIRALRRARADGVNATAEAAPHHLLLADEDIPADDGFYKMNPPLRSRDDVEAMVEGLCDGTLCAIATDNAPHTAAEKDCSFRDAAFGVITNEHTFALLYTSFVLAGRFRLDQLVHWLTDGPSDAYQLGPAGRIRVGGPADLAAFDLTREVTIDPERFAGMGRNTPFARRRVIGDCVLTMVDGQLVHRAAPPSSSLQEPTTDGKDQA
ncbi:Dihydroorotase [Acidipropionibacterium jensenii]|uniref:Dihydroorotase n=1 Tax=Acidipropionibacterium jensenii TaxID=1749 RepID=A0A3S4V0X9_9ACTN|nr:dihydroorotase [Acidipropionibacterium jensenii]VEI02273.1 Dihydroorotase [Acidipropionibacterium jensenii]